jgi:hypothetical protein
MVVEQDAKKKAKLLQKTRVEKKASDPISNPKTLSQSTILSLQERLTDFGYTPVDGKWGKKTAAAFRVSNACAGQNQSPARHADGDLSELLTHDAPGGDLRMNFEVMPELKYPFAYPVAIGKCWAKSFSGFPVPENI